MRKIKTISFILILSLLLVSANGSGYSFEYNGGVPLTPPRSMSPDTGNGKELLKKETPLKKVDAIFEMNLLELMKMDVFNAQHPGPERNREHAGPNVKPEKTQQDPSGIE